MNKFLSKIPVVLVAVLLMISNVSIAQNSFNSGDGWGAGWGTGAAFSSSAGSSLIYTTTNTLGGNVNRYFRFYGNGTPCGEYGPSGGSDVQLTPEVSYNSSTITCGTVKAFYVTVPNTTDNWVFKSAGISSAQMAIFRVQGTIRTISTVTRTTPAQDVAVTVTATLSGALATGQDVYLRYTNNSYSTSGVVKLTGSGTTYTGAIPASTNTAAANVSYYLFTSGSSNVASDGSNADFYTINLNNNGGSNYTYTVPTTYYSKGNLAPNTAANWNTKRDGTGTNATAFTSGVFVIQGTGGGLSAPHTMTSGSTMTFGAGVTLIVESGATLEQNSTITFNGTANFQLNAGSFFKQSATNASGISGGVEIWNPAATITYANTGYIATTNITGGAHPNVIVSTGGNANFAGAITNIAGSLTMAQTGTSLTLTGATAMTLTIGGNLNINSGTTFSLGNGAAVPVINLGGNLSIASGITFTYNGSGGSATFNFSKAGTQTLSNAGTMSGVVNYTVNNGATLDVGTSTVSGTGSFTVASGGGIITANTNATGALTSSGANGSILVTGTRTYNTGASYTFNGASAQVAGNGFTGAATLTINNSAGVTLSAATAVTGTLALTSGKLTLGANNLTLTGATITGASSSNYIVTNSTGSVLRSIASGGGTFAFPMGRSGSAYNPLTITNTGGTTAVYTVSTAATSYSPSADGANAQWNIAASASTTSTLAFGWLTADAGANLSAAPTSGLTWQYNGATWDNRGGTTTGTPNVTTVTGITSLTNPIWTVAMPTVVPDIALADNSGGQEAAGNIIRNTNNNIIYNFQTGITTANASLSSVAFTTTGTYAASDISNFRLYYSTTNSFGGASQIGTDITTSLGAGAHTFSSLAQTTNSGLTGYFWITTNVPIGATPGVNLAVSAITTTDLTYASGNKTGSTTGGGTKTIIDVPTVTTGAASALSTTGATLNGTVSANGASSTAGFDYGTTVSYGSTATAATSPVTTQGAAIDAAISSLTANTLYHFRATATNAAGGPVNGSDASFTTVSNAPVMDDVTARNPTSTGFTANWSAPAAQGAESYTYSIEVDDDNAFGSVNYSNTGISSATFSDAVSGLTSGITYYYRVKVVNAAGSSAWSATSASVTTTSAVAPSITTGTVTGSSIVVDGAEIAGNNVTSDGGDAIIARGLRYNTSTPADGVGGTTVPLGSGTTGTFNQTLSGLSANTLYYVKAYATNGVGTTYGGEVSFTTLATEPTTASTVAFGARTNTSLVVNFTGGDGGRRFVVARALNNSFSFAPADRVSLTGTIDPDFTVASNQGGGDKIVYDGTGTTVTVSGLTANTAYYFAVYEYNNNSAGSPNYYLTAGTGNQTTYNPTISIAGSLTAFGNVIAANVSTDQNYSVSGTELVSNITITPPAGFEIATLADFSDGVVNPSSLSLAPTGGTVSSTTIYARFVPSAATGATGTVNIAHTATDATTQNVAASGNAIDTDPTTQGSISFGTVTGTSIVVNLPSIGDGDKRIIVAKAGSAVDSDPADGVTYTANAAFGSGTQIGTGNFVVYSGTGTGAGVVTVTGLSSATTYHFAVYEYNEGTGTSQNYLTASTVTGNETTLVSSASTDAFRTFTSGDWNVNGTWESFSGGSWIAATLTPDNNASTITILNTHTVTIPSAVSITADEITVDAGGQITVASGGTLILNNGTGTDLTLNGYLKNSGTFTTTGASLSISGSTATYEHNVNNLTIPAGITWASASTLRLNGTYTGAGTAILSAGSYQNILWEGTISTSTDYVSIGDNVITVAGKLTASGTGAGALLTSAAGTSPTVAEYEQTSGVVFINRNSASTRSLTVTGNATISGGTLHIKTLTGAGAGQLIVGGNISQTGGTITNSTTSASSPAAILFNGAAAQTASFTTVTGATAGVSVTVSGAGGVTLNSDLTLPSNSILTLTSGNFIIAATKTLTLAGTSTGSIATGRTLTVDGTLARVSSGTFTTTGTLSISNGGTYNHAQNGGVIPTATWVAGSTCLVSGWVGSTTAPTGLGQSFHHFTWNSAGQTATLNLLGGLTTINGNFTVANTNTATNGLRLTNAAATINVGGNLVVAGSGTAKLDLNGGAGTLTMNVAGDVTIGAAGTLLSSGSAGIVKLGGNWSNSGTLTTANTTIEFNGTGTQTITKTGGETFRVLTINKASGDAVMPNDVTVSTTLTLTAGNLSIGSNTLTINGAVTRTSGNLAGSITSNVVVGGTAGSLFFDGTGSNNYLRNFTLNTGASATLGNALNITAYDGIGSEGALTVSGTATLTTGGFLTIRSDANGTARVGQGRTAGGYISGDVSVERYIRQNSSKGWRLLASNTSGQTINAAWQEGAVGGMVNPNPGYGTMITKAGSLATVQGQGFDTLSLGGALFGYDASIDDLVAPANTNATSLASQHGYFLFIRGDRSPGQFGAGAPTTSTTLRSKGTLFTGDQAGVTTNATTNWAIVRNPYPSRIDMRQIVRTGNLVDAFQVWDAKLGGSFGVGGYQTFSKSGADYVVVPGGGSYGSISSVQNFIESGAAFFIQSSGGTGTAQVVEAAKAASSSNASYRPTTPLTGLQQLTFNVYANNSGSIDMVDGGLVTFDNAYSNAVDVNDVRKSPNFGENFGIIRSNTDLVIERRQLINTDDTIFFDMNQMKQLPYRIDIAINNADPLITTGILQDKYTATNTNLDLTGVTNSYAFSVDANAASKAADRFRIVFKQSTVVPVSFVSVKAAQAGSNIAVEWKVANQVNVASYVIEKSADGRNFSNAGTVVATSSTTYNWLDVNVVTGNNYYRIKSVDNNGHAKYTNVVRVNIGKGGAAFTVSPNPVQGGLVNLQFTNQQAGKYGVRLINIAGQVVYNSTVQHAGGSSSQSFALPSALISGVYQLEVVAPDNSKQVEKLIVNTGN